ncbi:UDP-glucose 4-epimerase [Rhizobiales bacterium GAS188]|nr:UDP-glucose 4-epimerase [Rhizobiales bacterium GAS188]
MLKVSVRMQAQGKLKCAVFGGGGFIGTHLCRALIGAGAEVRAFGRGLVDRDAMHPGVSWTSGELSDIGAWQPLLNGVDVVYQLASSSTPQTADIDPAQDVADNVVCALRLFDAAVRSGVKKIIFLSSGGTIYGIPSRTPTDEDSPTLPISAYGLQKLTLEHYLHLYRRRHGIDVVIFRVANPYGPLQLGRKHQGVVPTFLRSALTGQPVQIWGTDDVVRDFIYIDDVVAALVLGVTYHGPHDTFNVGSGERISLRQVIDDIESVTGRGQLTRVYTAAAPSAVPISLLDCTRIRTEMHWSPKVNWSDGLHQTARWMAAYIDRHK